MFVHFPIKRNVLRTWEEAMSHLSHGRNEVSSETDPDGWRNASRMQYQGEHGSGPAGRALLGLAAEFGVNPLEWRQGITIFH